MVKTEVNEVVHQNCIPFSRFEECLHQSPAGHLQECLHCCEWLTVQLDPRALNILDRSRRKGELRKSYWWAHANLSFSLFEYFLGSSYGKNKYIPLNVTNAGMVSKMPKCHAFQLYPQASFLLHHSGLSLLPTAPLYVIFAQVSSRCFVMCWLWLGRLNFRDRGVRWDCCIKENTFVGMKVMPSPSSWR